MFDLYREQILERSKQPHFGGHVDSFTHQADGENRSCGDEIHIELAVHDGVMTEIRHTTRACAICAASADLLAESLQGKRTSELELWTPEKVVELLGIPLSPIRLKCALLPLETIKIGLSS